ncbi:MAG: HNH endonuclease signature motif containing protein [Rhizobiaceae bacterium]
MAWLEANRMMVISDYHRAFVKRFGRTDVTAEHLHGLRKRRGWKVGRDPARYKGRRLKYTDEQIAWLKANCTLPIADYHVAFVARFGRDDTTAEHLHGLRKREGWKTGRTGQYEKGAVPANKGKKYPPGKGGNHPNARRTQFCQGDRPLNYRGPGEESIGADGYVWIILDQRNPWTGAATWRVHKHRWLWEKTNGPVPEGHVLKCLDGDRTNTDPSNWEAVPRGLLPRLNGKSGRAYDAAPAEVKPTIMVVAKLEHAVRQPRRAE